MIVTDIDGIIDKTIDILKADPNMKMVSEKDWHKVNGIIPGKKFTISAGCDDEDYETYTRDWDKGTAKIKIFASLDNKSLPGNERRKDEDRLEYGERVIRQFARNIRQCLIDNHNLGGVASTSFPRKIEYVTADEHVDLHIAVIHFDVEFYSSRKRRSQNTVNEIDAIFQGKRIVIEKGED